MTDTPLWERQEGETDKAYEAFALYRDMGASRSVRDVAQKLGKSATLISRWSSANNWVERVSAWDDQEDERRRERNAKRQIEVEQNAWKDYSAIRRAIDKRVQTFEAASWAGTVYDISGLLELMRKADDLARRTVGLPDKITESKADITSNGETLSWADAIRKAREDIDG